MAPRCSGRLASGRRPLGVGSGAAARAAPSPPPARCGLAAGARTQRRRCAASRDARTTAPRPRRAAGRPTAARAMLPACSA
eukprot:scaffold370_cov289-Prasinococcus_capsulatus_cf.AAC.12